MTATIDIESLKREIEEDRRALAEKEAVLAYLLKRTGTSSSRNNQIIDEVSQSSNYFKLDELVPDANKQTFIEIIQDVVKRFGGQEFTVSHVEAALSKIGKKIEGKSPRARISGVLTKLEENHVLTKTYEGKGSTPHRYKLSEYVDLA